MPVCLQGRGAEGSGDPYVEKEDELKQISWNLACAKRPGFNLSEWHLFSFSPPSQERHCESYSLLLNIYLFIFSGTFINGVNHLTK
jgi:hypothetical protein